MGEKGYSGIVDPASEHEQDEIRTAAVHAGAEPDLVPAFASHEPVSDTRSGAVEHAAASG